MIDVQLDRVGAGVLHHAGVARPAAFRCAVEAGDDGDGDGLFCALDVPEVAVGAEVVILEIGQIAGGFGRAFGAALEGAIEIEGLE
jgi:hypothetical protein